MTAFLHRLPQLSTAPSKPRPAEALMLAAALALASLASLVGADVPARAQFMSNYPVIVVPPPPAQNLFVPKPKPIAPKPAPAPARGQTQQTEEYHGQTREPVGRF